MSLSLRRDRDTTSPDFYLVHHEGVEAPVGRIYKQLGPGGSAFEWFWGLGFPYSLNEPRPFYGTVGSLEEAMAAFRECWERKPRV